MADDLVNKQASLHVQNLLFLHSALSYPTRGLRINNRVRSAFGFLYVLPADIKVTAILVRRVRRLHLGTH